jgi:lipopolysaccharide export system protein LptA
MFDMLGVFAEFEREMIVARVNAGLARAKRAIERDGQFISKAGTVRTRLGRPGALPDQIEAAAPSWPKGPTLMTVDATLLEIFDSANKAVFTGNVNAVQGDMKLTTAQLTAFFSGKAGLGLSDAGNTAGTVPANGVKGKGREKSEIVRLEARQQVVVSSPEQTATSKWADFDVKANTALLGGGPGESVVVDCRSSMRRTP